MVDLYHLTYWFGLVLLQAYPHFESGFQSVFEFSIVDLMFFEILRDFAIDFNAGYICNIGLGDSHPSCA